MAEGNPSGDDWAVRGTWASLHALDVLSPHPDPVLSGVLDLGERVCGGPLTLELRDGDRWLPVARRPAGGPTGAAGEPAGPDAAGPSIGGGQQADADTDADAATVAVAGLPVGRLAGPASADGALELVAAQLSQLLEQRWQDAQLDDAGQPVGIVVLDDEATIRYMNDAVSVLVDGSTERWWGRPVTELLTTGQAEAAGELLAEALHGRNRSASIPVLLDFGTGTKIFEVQSDTRFADPDVGGLVFIVRAPRDADDDHSILGDQMWVLNRLRSGQPSDEVLERVVDLLERRNAGGHCCVMLLDDSGDTLQPAIWPRLHPDVVEALRDTRVGPLEPGGGASIHFNGPQFWPVLDDESSFARQRAALQAHGYRSCWSMPITSMVGNRKLGSLDLYRPEPGRPAETEARVMVMAARLAALAIDQERHERALRHAATHDPLTGLPNRTLFAERLDEASAHGNLAVLFVDLDRFKLINDTMGHEFGDELLQAVASRLAGFVREPAIVARFGGDEFTVLLPKVESRDEAVGEAERLLTVIAEPYRVRGQTVSIRASAGVATAADPPSVPLALVRDADAALYHAKDRGRGRVEVFDQRLLVAAEQRLEVERHLVDALDAGMIEVVFQPEVSLVDGRVIGVEALARCRTTTGATIAPALFIPVAEETGLITRVFTSVLADSCRATKQWNASRQVPLVVWVNLSPLQLGSPDLVGQVARAIEMSGADPSTLGFEVTERAILSDPDDAAERLRSLVALGCHAALDDFGTGYSSLSHLHDLPVDTVKLDRAFVVRAGRDARSRAIVGGVVHLVDEMGLRCVAEGVETRAELDTVTALGCDIVQGFIFSRPKSAADVSRMVNAIKPPFAPR